MDTVPAYVDWRPVRQLRWAGLADYGSSKKLLYLSKIFFTSQHPTLSLTESHTEPCTDNVCLSKAKQSLVLFVSCKVLHSLFDLRICIHIICESHKLSWKKSLKNQHQRNLQSALCQGCKKIFLFFSKRFLARQAGKGGEGGSLGVLKWREKIISYREVTHIATCILFFPDFWLGHSKEVVSHRRHNNNLKTSSFFYEEIQQRFTVVLLPNSVTVLYSKCWGKWWKFVLDTKLAQEPPIGPCCQ